MVLPNVYNTCIHSPLLTSYCHRYIMDDVLRLGSYYDDDKDDHVTWEEYSVLAFGKNYKGTGKAALSCITGTY